mmetsp:Transcript_19579/g.60523  ORF Transcript_19579/g.60523 Transcript_19579/m.60523 type:complete len:270 (+) Transcript_19579:1953-2762(+)
MTAGRLRDSSSRRLMAPHAPCRACRFSSKTATSTSSSASSSSHVATRLQFAVTASRCAAVDTSLTLPSSSASSTALRTEYTAVSKSLRACWRSLRSCSAAAIASSLLFAAAVSARIEPHDRDPSRTVSTRSVRLCTFGFVTVVLFVAAVALTTGAVSFCVSFDDVVEVVVALVSSSFSSAVEVVDEFDSRVSSSSSLAAAAAAGGGTTTLVSLTCKDTSALESVVMPDESKENDSWTLGLCVALVFISLAKSATPEMLYNAMEPFSPEA